MKTNLPSNTPADTLNIPPQLASRSQWVLWKIEKRDGKSTKVPYSARGGNARTSQPETWESFDAVLTILAAEPNRYNGLGFVFTPDDPFCGVDLDDCLNPDGTLKDWAAPITAMFDGTYCEVSPSGTGLKLFCLGRTTGGRKLKISDDPNSDEAIDVITAVAATSPSPASDSATRLAC